MWAVSAGTSCTLSVGGSEADGSCDRPVPDGGASEQAKERMDTVDGRGDTCAATWKAASLVTFHAIVYTSAGCSRWDAWRPRDSGITWYKSNCSWLPWFVSSPSWDVDGWPMSPNLATSRWSHRLSTNTASVPAAAGYCRHAWRPDTSVVGLERGA